MEAHISLQAKLSKKSDQTLLHMFPGEMIKAFILKAQGFQALSIWHLIMNSRKYGTAKL